MFRIMIAKLKPVGGLFLGLLAFAGLFEFAVRSQRIPSDMGHLIKAQRKGKGGLRVLILGDSLTIDSTQLEGYIEKLGGVTLNLAKAGFCPIEYLQRFDRYGRAFRPQWVILNYTVQNDLVETEIRITNAVMSSTLPRLYFWDVLLEKWLFINSKLGYWRAWIEYRDYIASRVPGLENVVNPYLAMFASKYPDFWIRNLLVQDPNSKKTWVKIQSLIQRLNENVRSIGGSLVINILPATVQVNESHFSFFSKLGFDMSKEFLITSVPQNLMLELCDGLSIQCNDLLPGFRKHRELEFYDENDDHWNDHGKRLAFELIKSKLESGWILSSPQIQLSQKE